MQTTVRELVYSVLTATHLLNTYYMPDTYYVPGGLGGQDHSDDRDRHKPLCSWESTRRRRNKSLLSRRRRELTSRVNHSVGFITGFSQLLEILSWFLYNCHTVTDPFLCSRVLCLV